LAPDQAGLPITGEPQAKYSLDCRWAGAQTEASSLLTQRKVIALEVDPQVLLCLLAVRQLGGKAVPAKQDLFSKGLPVHAESRVNGICFLAEMRPGFVYEFRLRKLAPGKGSSTPPRRTTPCASFRSPEGELQAAWHIET
jgi:hypothetical protein